MDEGILQIIASLKIVWLALYSFLYGRGGISNKPIRRVAGSFLLTAGIVGFSLWTKSFNPWYCSCFLLLFGSTSLGYGADKLLEKLWKRFYCGAAYAMVGLPMAVVNSNWTMLSLHICLCISFSMVLGIINPCKSARDEETLIAVVIGLLPLYMC